MGRCWGPRGPPDPENRWFQCPRGPPDPEIGVLPLRIPPVRFGILGFLKVGHRCRAGRSPTENVLTPGTISDRKQTHARDNLRPKPDSSAGNSPNENSARGKAWEKKPWIWAVSGPETAQIHGFYPSGFLGFSEPNRPEPPGGPRGALKSSMFKVWKAPEAPATTHYFLLKFWCFLVV